MTQTLNDQQAQRQPEGYGIVTSPGTVRFERVFPGPIERVWSYLTDSEKRGKWLASGEMELRVGGRVDLFFHHADLSFEKTPPAKFKQIEDGFRSSATVTRYEPPRLLGITWFESVDQEVTFELFPQDGNVRFVLTHHRIGKADDMANFSSGWHAHLAMLADQLNGREPRPFWTNLVALEADYGKKLQDGELVAWEG